jgi:hypothetical protein
MSIEVLTDYSDASSGDGSIKTAVKSSNGNQPEEVICASTRLSFLTKLDINRIDFFIRFITDCSTGYIQQA